MQKLSPASSLIFQLNIGRELTWTGEVSLYFDDVTLVKKIVSFIQIMSNFTFKKQNKELIVIILKMFLLVCFLLLCIVCVCFNETDKISPSFHAREVKGGNGGFRNNFSLEIDGNIS